MTSSFDDRVTNISVAMVRIWWSRPLTTHADQPDEHLTLVGDGDLTGTGTSDPNRLTGNDGNNVLSGLGDNDTLDGGGGDDTLIGGAGGDTLDGGSGADSMDGGEGGDLYRVDDAGDAINDTGTSGDDTVEAAITYTLGADVEHLTLTGAAAIDGTGNDGANVLTGNDAANTLDGGEGNDTLAGGGGADTYDVGDGDDRVTGSAADLGGDRSPASVTTMRSKSPISPGSAAATMAATPPWCWRTGRPQAHPGVGRLRRQSQRR